MIQIRSSLDDQSGSHYIHVTVLFIANLTQRKIDSSQDPLTKTSLTSLLGKRKNLFSWLRSFIHANLRAEIRNSLSISQQRRKSVLNTFYLSVIGRIMQ